MLENWKETILPPTATLREALQLLQSLGLQIVMIADEDLKLVGIVTDPDTRRAFLRGETLDQLCHIKNRFPRLSRHLQEGRRLALMHRYQIGQIPLVDSSGRVTVLVMKLTKSTQGHANAVVIMAGGEGRRLRSLTESIPKPIPVRGRPILELIIGS